MKTRQEGDCLKARKRPSLDPEPHLNLDLGLFILQNCGGNNSVIYTTQSVVLFYGSPSSLQASQVVLEVKNLPVNAGDIRDADSIPGSGRSPGGGNGNPLQYSCLKMPQTEEPGGLQSMGLPRVGLN